MALGGDWVLDHLKRLTTEAQRARRRKCRRFRDFFSVNYYNFLCVLRVSVVNDSFSVD
jgi:hypothetical protein